MKYSIISTWKMSYEGVCKAEALLKENKKAKDAIVVAINDVEENINYHSVGKSGLPNEEGIVQCDAGYMEGDTLKYGAVGAVEEIVHVVNLAKICSQDRFNNVLVGAGANDFAEKCGFVKEEMSTSVSLKMYENRKGKEEILSSYDGHDTVGMVMLDSEGHLCTATSTSGLFMKKKGRIGDSPIVGCGFYCDDEVGGATATGVGEEIMRGCLSYEVISRMKLGMNPQKAAESCVYEWTQRMLKMKGYADSISLICMNKEGEIGVGTNLKFAFVCANEYEKAKIMIAEPKENKVIFREIRETDIID